MAEPNLSIIIPARNEENCIGHLIDSILQNEYGDYEIIVVNDGSEDRTVDIVRKYMENTDKIRLISFLEGHSAAFARNAGAREARGEILVFLDADLVIEKGFLETIAEDFEKYSQVSVLRGGLNIPKETTFLARCLAIPTIIANRGQREMKVEVILGHSMDWMPWYVRRSWFEKIGMFDESTFYFEDRDLRRRAVEMGDFKCLVGDDRIINYCELPSTFEEFIKQAQYITKGLLSSWKGNRREIGKHVLKSMALVGLGLILINSLSTFLIILASLWIYFFYKSGEFWPSLGFLGISALKTLLITIFLPVEIVKRAHSTSRPRGM